MIKRLWHGWTTPANANAYLRVLTQEVIPGIESKNLPGFKGIELLRFDHGEEVEFITLMSFEKLEDIISFQGPDYERCYVPDVARKVLKRWDETARHYELAGSRTYE